MMEVGVLQFRVRLRGCTNLKAKRKVILSLKDRLRSRFHVAVAEVDDQDVYQVGTLGVATVGNDSHKLVARLQKIVDQLRVHPEAELLDHQIDIL